jgi:hypothetical protein
LSTDGQFERVAVSRVTIWGFFAGLPGGRPCLLGLTYGFEFTEVFEHDH